MEQSSNEPDVATVTDEEIVIQFNETEHRFNRLSQIIVEN